LAPAVAGFKPPSLVDGAGPAFLDVADRAKKFYANFGDVLASKRTTALTAMKDNGNWPGLLLRLADQYPSERLDLGIEVDFLDEPGSAPLLLCSRRGSWRWGPSVLPLCGSGALLVAASPSVNFFTLDVARLLQQGIALRDVAQFFGTNSGDAFASEHCHWVPVKEGGALYVPPGHVATLAVIDAPGVAAEAGAELGIAWAQHVASKARLAALPQPVRAALARFHADHASHAEPRRLWTALHSLFQKMLE
jgi:hypothetical protein